MVETPAFGTKTKGFFKDSNISGLSSREGSREPNSLRSSIVKSAKAPKMDQTKQQFGADQIMS